MRVDVVGSERHYYSHMVPIYNALPDELKGDIHPIRPINQITAPPRSRVAMVASWQDMAPLRHLTRFIYVEHGAGQSYGGDVKTAHWPGYSLGGAKHTDVLGYICPSQTVADRWAPANAVAVGCPKLDALLSDPIEPDPRSVCIAFHWDCRISPEARSAFEHYAHRLRDIVQAWRDQGWEVWGHAHPKWEGQIDDTLRRAGCTVTSKDDAVLRRCGMLVMDNSSLMYEFAALNKPVITLNAPWYRRDINHGLRFWDSLPGPVSSHPEELVALDLDHAHEKMHQPAWTYRRLDVASNVYAHRDGKSSQRAAEAIAGWVTGLV